MESIAALVTLLAYAVVLFGVGIWSARRSKSQEDFLLGGRSLGPVVSGIAYAASSSSAWVLLGFSGFVYAAGPSALWMIPGIIIGYIAVWFGVGPILQSESKSKGHLTLTDFLAEGASKKLATFIRIAASFMIAFSFSFYVAAQFQGAGLAFDDLFGIGLASGIVLGAAVILIYTFLGGFLAVSLINTVQGLLMAIIAIALPTLAFMEAGGFAGLSAALAETPGDYQDSFGGRTGWAALGLAMGLFGAGYHALGQPHLLAWIMATRSKSARRVGGCIAIGWAALVFTGMGVLGLSARALFGAEAPAEGVFFQLAGDLFPAILAGLIAAATLSAIMSTVDSLLLVAGGAISHDLGLSHAFGGRDVLATRLAILAVCIVATLITFAMPASIFDRALFAWTSLGASFGPLVVARAFGIKPSGGYILASMILGFVLSLVFQFAIAPGPGGVWSRTIPWMTASVPLALFALTKLAPRQAIDTQQ